MPHLDLVSGVATSASPIPGDSGPRVDLLDLVNMVLTWSFPDPGTLVTTWDSPGPGESGPHLGLHCPVDFLPHLDLIAVDSSWPQLNW